MHIQFVIKDCKASDGGIHVKGLDADAVSYFSDTECTSSNLLEKNKNGQAASLSCWKNRQIFSVVVSVVHYGFSSLAILLLFVSLQSTSCGKIRGGDIVVMVLSFIKMDNCNLHLHSRNHNNIKHFQHKYLIWN